MFVVSFWALLFVAEVDSVVDCSVSGLVEVAEDSSAEISVEDEGAGSAVVGEGAAKVVIWLYYCLAIRRGSDSNFASAACVLTQEWGWSEMRKLKILKNLVGLVKSGRLAQEYLVFPERHTKPTISLI